MSIRLYLSVIAVVTVGFSTLVSGQTNPPEETGCSEVNPVLILDADTLDFHQRGFPCVNRNDVFRIRLLFQNGFTTDVPNTVSVGSKTSTGSIKIKKYVPEKQLLRIQVGDIPGDYEYFIKVDGVGTIDPRVRVINNAISDVTPADGVAERLEEVNNYLIEELGVDLTELENSDLVLKEATSCNITEALEMLRSPESPDFCENAVPDNQ